MVRKDIAQRAYLKRSGWDVRESSWDDSIDGWREEWYRVPFFKGIQTFTLEEAYVRQLERDVDALGGPDTIINLLDKRG